LESADADLVRRARRGDDGAFRELVDRHGPGLYRMAFSLVGNAADAEDALQETLLGAFRHLGRFEQRSSVRTWLTRIVMRQAARVHRGRRRTAPLPETQEAKGGTAAGVRMDVLAALDKLAPIHRDVITLREIQGMRYEEIATVLGIPIGTVESRLHRARAALREELRDYLEK